jgi:pyridoxamine 5'-phosphate oxidase
MLDELLTFELIDADIWVRLQQGKAESRHAFHCATAATFDAEFGVTLRTVVLRRVDAVVRMLQFHTDCRSPKFSTLKNDPRIGLLFYDAAARLQIRIHATATLHTDDAIADDAWEQSARHSRLCYTTPLSPGATLEHIHIHTPAPDGDGRGHFAVVRCHVKNIDWLYLNHQGHRRCQLQYADQNIVGQWVAP